MGVFEPHRRVAASGVGIIRRRCDDGCLHPLERLLDMLHQNWVAAQEELVVIAALHQRVEPLVVHLADDESGLPCSAASEQQD